MLSNYLKMAWKVLGRRRFFTFVSLFGIGFTLMVVMGVAAMVDADLAPGYPEMKRDRILAVTWMLMRGDESAWVSAAGYKTLNEYTRGLPGVQSLSIISEATGAISFLDGRKITSQMRYTDAEFWRVMEFEFLEGASFTETDDRNGKLVAVIDAATRRRFFGEQTAIGRTLDLDGREFRVLGVVRNVPINRNLTTANVWAPIGAIRDPKVLETIIGDFYGAYLLKPGADRREVQAAFRERLTRVELPDPERFHTLKALAMTRLEELSNELFDLDADETAPGRVVLMGVLAVLAFMLLPAINLININLSRIYERTGEIGVRKAFGASSRDLVGQFVVENIVLSLLGGVIGLIGSWVGLQILTRLPQVPHLEPRFSGRFFLVALAAALVFGLLSGVGPAWRMSRQHVVSALRGGTS